MLAGGTIFGHHEAKHTISSVDAQINARNMPEVFMSIDSRSTNYSADANSESASSSKRRMVT